MMLSRKKRKEFTAEPIEVHYSKDSGEECGSIKIIGSKVGILTALGTLMHAMITSGEFTIIDFKELVKMTEVAENELK